ncbi:MAG TPA: hypothetical protein VFR83_02185 [Burkholderiales bacterium]|nr:hypothetical protein [Burkholderiales bacterium]
MSLSWLKKKPVRIGLGARRILVSGTREVQLQAVELQAGDDWRGALGALPEILKPHRGSEASVVLADQFARYALLQHNDAVRSNEQWLALARHRFGALHGAVAADWDVKVTQTAPLGARLACAVDRELIEQLAGVFVAGSVKLISVQPFLVAAFNRIRKTVGNGSCWIVVEEPGRLTLALLQRGAWVAIRSRRSDDRWRVVLPEILERESAFLGLDEPCTRVIVCAQGEFDPQMHDAWRAQKLSYRDLALAWE